MVTMMNDLAYADRYVAYLDILGFTNLTHLAHRDISYRAHLRDIIQQTNAMLPRSSAQSNFRFVQFSDSIVISAKQDRDGLLVIVQSVTMLMNHMLDRGTLLRGGIALGNLHHDNQMMFGPAYLSALAFDKIGSGPRIGLMDEVVESMDGGIFDDSVQHLICQDPWDLTPMLHTLRDFELYDGTVFHEGGFTLHSWAVRLAAIITTNALNMKSAAPVRAKWRWMQDYWNRTVASKNILPRAEPADWSLVRKQAHEQEVQAVCDFNARNRAKPPLNRDDDAG